MPPGSRILLVESGSRSLMESTVPLLMSTWAGHYQFDLVTCYGGVPDCLPADTDVFRVYEYNTPEGSDVLTEVKKCVQFCRATVA